jgi:uncharacterized protein YceK
MRRFWIAAAAAALLVSGCSKAKSSTDSAALASYQGYYTAIEDSDKFAGSSLYYTLSAEMSELPDGTHRYYIFLDQPQIAMYDVVVMSVEDDIPYDQSVKMMPSVGIFDTEEYSLIPFQSYQEGGFVKGLVLSGECEASEVLLKIVVEWKDRTLENTTREFLSLKLNMDGFTHPEDDAGSTANGASAG